MDDTFTAIKAWVIEFCEIVIKENLNMKWIANTRADTYDIEMLKIMKKAGLVKIKVGIESICPRIRNGIFNKNVSYQQITSLINDCTKLGIQVAGFFMIGAPTETKKEIWETIKFALNSRLMEASFSITTPLPQTSLYDMALKNKWDVPDKFEDYDYYSAKGKENKERINSTSLEMYKKIAYILFYMHPRRILNTLRMSLSINGFKRTLLKLQRL